MWTSSNDDRKKKRTAVFAARFDGAPQLTECTGCCCWNAFSVYNIICYTPTEVLDHSSGWTILSS